MRKFALAVATMLFMTGLVIATEGVITKVDTEAKTVSIKVGEDVKDYKYTDKVAVTLLTGKDGEKKEGKFEDLEKRFKAFKADSKFGNKITFEAEGDKITSVTMRAAGKKKTNN